LTPRQRLRLARLIVEDGWPVARAAEWFQVSWPTAKRWADRYRLAGSAGMTDRSSRPHTSPGRTPPPMVRKIVHLRSKRRLGPVAIAAQVGLAASTVYAVLRRCRINRLSQLDRRPRYPDELVARILAAAPGTEVLDVGCGTGIEARQFQAAGATVLGVEPDPRMAAFARRRGLAVEVSTFEAWDPGGRKFDAVVAGTAWHWVDPVAGAAAAARVLRPGGRLAPFWHVSAPPPNVADAFATAVRRVVPDAPFDASGPRTTDAYQPLLNRAADGIRAAGGFDEPEQWRYDGERTYPRDEWLDQLPTSGALTRLDPDALDEVLAAVGAAIDAQGGRVTVPHTVYAVSAVRSGPRSSGS
jgi:SAM-dependent methyltransferase